MWLETYFYNLQYSIDDKSVVKSFYDKYIGKV